MTRNQSRRDNLDTVFSLFCLVEINQNYQCTHAQDETIPDYIDVKLYLNTEVYLFFSRV